MGKSHTAMSDVLRAAIIDSGMNLAAIERETGIDRSSLSRFVAGERSMRLDMADQLARYFGIALTKGITMKADDKGRKGFRELTLQQMRASIASTQRHLNDMKRVYEEEKQRRAGDASR
jgi:transcriptional regulator with XRE-family HTH domain